MTNGEWIALLAIVIPVIIGLFVLIFKLGELHNSIKAGFVKIISMDIKLEKLWRGNTTENNSPMQLNEHGKKILKDSNIKSFIDRHLKEIIFSVRELSPMNAWEVQEATIKVVGKLKEKESYRLELEESMSHLVSDIDTILFVAAVYIRDIVIKELNFKHEDIDKNDPQKGFDPKK